MSLVGLLWLLACGPAAPTEADREARWRGEVEDCGPGLPDASLDEAIALGRAFLLASQKPEGNFHYEYDWKAGIDSTDDNEVRQAGATWGLSLLLHDAPDDAEVLAALLRALDFWKGRSIELGERRIVRYTDRDQRAGTGTIALLALAHVELLRSGAPLPDERRAEVEAQLSGYLQTLLAQRTPVGGFHSYVSDKGKPFGRPNPYADGEAVLALVKAAKYVDGHGHLLQLAVPWVTEDHARNVTQARALEPDSDTTKGYYQWSSMTWHELATSEAADRGPFTDWLMELAVWMIDTHQTLRRRRNTAYAYEGIVPAYHHAHRLGDPRADKFACVVDQGLRKLTTWQVGHPLALPYLQSADPTDARARGGVQNIGNEPTLRVDVAQHQVHALILLRRLDPRR
jgi:UDP-N-acetylmuramoyl-tripeptide--D-alanyl-D-alanine ligase